MNRGRLRPGWRLLVALLACSSSLGAQTDARSLRLRETAGSPLRFVSATGQRAFLGGYGVDGLEFWAYPVQVVRNYRVAFRPAGATTFLDGRELLTAVETTPSQTTRVYVGPGFQVREILFVPTDRAAAILSYQVSGMIPVDIEVRATPVLDLMWPAGMGGQSTSWNETLGAFILSEPANGYSAVIASSQISSHDSVGNDRSASGGIAFTLTPDSDHRAQLFITLNEKRGEPIEPALKALESEAGSLRAEASTHWEGLENAQLQLTTPDPRVNSALAWAETAVEQAWVCNADLGCGFVGGYGPSHATRRPQYDWFFAGDGLIAARGALDAGDWQHARQELEFILRYRDAKTGMIWHEMSQSAGLIDWKGKYPYMFVHVDVTFQFLDFVAQYVRASGDRDFVRANWDALLAAYRYCSGVIDAATALPRIPADKEGGNEQDRMADDLGLSVLWVQAAQAFAALAEQKGEDALAREAAHAAESARKSIVDRYWNPDRQFWINGHTADGKAIDQLRSGPPEALDLLGEERSGIVLDKLSSADFLTDWGVRSLSAKSNEYDPESYAKGSVWPVATAGLATAFWQHHRPAAAFDMWSSLLNVAALDAPGHLHEVLSGSFFTPQSESVPEQTWSSAGIVSSTVQGLLGLQTDSLARRLRFAPGFPDDWDYAEVKHIRLGSAFVSLTWGRTSGGQSVAIDNEGEPIAFWFEPLLPLGASLGRAQFNGASTPSSLENHPQETRARIELTVPHGHSDLSLTYSGGISISLPHERLLAGDASSGLRILTTRIANSNFMIDADAQCDRASRIRMRSSWKLASPTEATFQPLAGNIFEATIPTSSCPAGSYHRVHLEFGIQK